jgi:predicted O-methyltransferase YrrM
VRRILRAYHLQPGLQDRLRYHVKPFRPTSPIPNRFELDPRPPDAPKPWPFLAADPSAYASLLSELAPFLRDLPAELPLHNTWYGGADAALLYAMVRKLKPARVVEVGCGYSTRILCAACRHNEAHAPPADVLCIDPLPRREWQDLPATFDRRPVQQTPIERFARLGPNDLLFVDSSHVLKMQSDVLFLLAEALPILSPGVVVHVHDIFTPYDYPPEFSLDTCHMNEQYALECLLANSPGWQVLLPLHHLHRAKPEWLAPLCPGAPGRPSAFWMRKTEPPTSPSHPRLPTPLRLQTGDKTDSEGS